MFHVSSMLTCFFFSMFTHVLLCLQVVFVFLCFLFVFYILNVYTFWWFHVILVFTRLWCSHVFDFYTFVMFTCPFNIYTYFRCLMCPFDISTYSWYSNFLSGTAYRKQCKSAYINLTFFQRGYFLPFSLCTCFTYESLSTSEAATGGVL